MYLTNTCSSQSGRDFLKMSYNEQESCIFDNFPLIIYTKGVEDVTLTFGVRNYIENIILNLYCLFSNLVIHVS